MTRSVSGHMTPCKKQYRLEAHELFVERLGITKIECTSRMCLRYLLPFNRFVIVAGDNLEALLEGVDASNTKQILQ